MCGVWNESPLGPIADLMWARPDGHRVLVAPSHDVAAFVSAVYVFDETVVASNFSASVADRTLSLDIPECGLSLWCRAGRGWPIPLSGPPWITRHVAGPIARRALGVRTYGISPTGVREWYRARWYRPLVEGRATLACRDLGALAPLLPPVRFGFSEPPRRPSMVWVRPVLHDPSGRLTARGGG